MDKIGLLLDEERTKKLLIVAHANMKTPHELLSETIDTLYRIQLKRMED